VTDTVSADYNVSGVFYPELSRIVYLPAIEAQNNDILYRRVLLWFFIWYFLVYPFRFLG